MKGIIFAEEIEKYAHPKLELGSERTYLRNNMHFR